MPTYEFRCTKCGHEFEAFQSITAKPLSRCPICKGRVKRLIGTGGGILFKGSGFYQTDDRSEGYQKKAKEESKGSDGGSKEGATEKKAAPEKKSEPKTKKAKDAGTA
jgi:putative FmdB family regulatory protein